MLHEETKHKIIDALEVYMEQHKLSQNEVMQKSKVNASYLIALRKKQFFIVIKDKPVVISDSHLLKLARFIGFELNQNEIPVKLTDQLKFIISKLEDAKNNVEPARIIAATGSGKTFTLELFKRKHPNDVFSIKVGSQDAIGDILDKINDEIGAYMYRCTKSRKIKDICNTLKALKDEGREPMLVLDEMEFAKQPTLSSVKEVIDALEGFCSLVQLGTPELLENMKSLVKRQKAGMAQLERRLKFKTHFVPEIDRSFPDFIQDFDPAIKKFFTNNCANYGEVVDVLRPCKRESERLNQPITLQLIETVMSL